MNEQERQYIQNVKSLVDKDTETITTIDELARLEKPSSDVISINTQCLIEYIDNLELEREDGELDGGAKDYTGVEQRIAINNLQNVKRILVDIDKDNWYMQVFWAELAYSHLKDGEYTYKLVNEKMNAQTVQEAEKEKDQVRTKARKQHPDDPDYSLEDVRVKVEIVDGVGKIVESQKFLLN